MNRFDERLMCDVRELNYDFTSRTGTIMIGDGNCTDMQGCIGLFCAIDCEVLSIETIALGEHERTVYVRINGEWESRRIQGEP